MTKHKIQAIATLIGTLLAVSCTPAGPDVRQSMAMFQSPEGQALERAHPRVR